MPATRPAEITDAHLTYLDDLRDRGYTNMYDATPFIRAHFSVDLKTARDILRYWMLSYGRIDR